MQRRDSYSICSMYIIVYITNLTSPVYKCSVYTIYTAWHKISCVHAYLVVSFEVAYIEKKSGKIGFFLFVR